MEKVVLERKLWSFFSLRVKFCTVEAAQRPDVWLQIFGFLLIFVFVFSFFFHRALGEVESGLTRILSVLLFSGSFSKH